MVSRRRFLRVSLWGGALLGAAALVGRHLSGYSLDPEISQKLRALSAKEFLILRAVTERMVAPDATDAPTAESTGAALFADGYLARLDDAMRSDVRALLQLLEHGSGLFRLGSIGRFTHMSDEDKDATLADWSQSRLEVRRRGFAALKTLAMLGYWRADATWPLIGYTGPMLPKVPT